MPRYDSSLNDGSVEDGDIGYLGMNMRLPDWQLSEGMLSLSENGRIDGGWTPRRGIEVVSNGSLSLGSPLRVPFWLIDEVGGLVVSAASRVGELVSLTVTGHGLQLGIGGAYLKLEGVSGVPVVNPNKVWVMTPTNANTLTFEIAGATGSETYTVSGSARVVSRLDDTSSAMVLGSCLYSDPSSDDSESIFLAFGGLVAKVSLSDGNATRIDLPAATTLDGEIEMIQAMDKVFIFRGGLVALEWVRGAAAFVEVASGACSQPQVLTSSGAGIVISGGLVEFTVTGNTTVEVGSMVKIHSATDVRFAGVVGQSFMVVSITGTTKIRCYIALSDSASGSNSVSLGVAVSLGGGFIRQPAFPWAVYFQRRLWGPYWYSSSGTSTFTDRNVRDELVAGDILETDFYDPIQNQFRITGGIADRIVGLHPYFDDTLLVMNRNSIHSISGTVGSLADCSVKELTREIGCLARKSVVAQGSNVFFLSDNGIYGLDFLEDYNLRGIGKPLSEAIQPLIDRISQTLASKAIGIYHDNRIWMAVPLDTTPRQGDATGNNAVLVFNLLNNQWESVDTFGDPSFTITNLIVGTAGVRNDLYAVTPNGGIHIFNKLDEDYDRIATNPASAATHFLIPARMTTRSYMGKTLERKRFSRMGVQVKSGNSQGDFGMIFSTEDPDSNNTEILASQTMIGPLPAHETADVRQRIGGERGFNGSITIRREIGRPEIRGTKVLATITNRATITQN